MTLYSLKSTVTKPWRAMRFRLMLGLILSSAGLAVYNPLLLLVAKESVHYSGSASYLIVSPCSIASGFSGQDNKDRDIGDGSCVDGHGVCSQVVFATDMPFEKPVFAALTNKSFLVQPSVPFPISRCQQVQLAESPGWLTTTFWTENSSYLGMFNSYRSEMYLYDSRGVTVRKTMTDVPIEAIVNYRGRLLAKGHGNSFFFFGQDLKRAEPFAVPRFRSIYSGWVVNGNEIVAYGSLDSAGTKSENPQNGFRLGFVRLNLANHSAELVLPFEDNRFYLINNQYLTTSNGETYFIAAGSTSTIYKLPINRPAVPLKAMPAEYSKFPSLQDFVGPMATSKRFSQMESLRMPAGLYGYEGFLYLLGRDPDSCKPWSLYKIDPVGDRLVGSVHLPTFARHLTIVPGEHEWLLIEKGAVVVAGHQKIKTIEAVPTSWITQPEKSPLQLQSGLTDCFNGD